MSKPRRLDRPVFLNISLPESVKGRLDLHLWSEVDSRVPHGAYSRWTVERVEEFFAWKTLDLAPFGFSPGMFVRGPEEVVRQLAARLEASLLAAVSADARRE